MILYFSGTGNSKYAANKINEILKDEIISINDLLKNKKTVTFKENERIVIVTPTYAWRMPLIVHDWLKTCHFMNNKIYFVMTCGGEIGNSAKYNKQLSTELGLTYLGTAPIMMPDNYIIMFNPVSQEKVDEIFKTVDEKIIKIATLIQNNEPFPKPRNNLYDRFMSGCINPSFYKKYVKKTGFMVNDQCISCGTCEQKCPLNIISMKDGKPAWNSVGCTQCMACISYCPKQAIDYQNKTQGKRRYTIESYKNK